MTSIVEQIQHDALDHNVPVSTLLRRVKLAATKLGLGAVEDWVEQELKGYRTHAPDYRVVAGRPMARNPYRGWEPSWHNRGTGDRHQRGRRRARTFGRDPRRHASLTKPYMADHQQCWRGQSFSISLSTSVSSPEFNVV
jgi:hypothetical protein